MEVIGSQSLLEIAFINLLKNACSYSDNKKARIFIAKKQDQLLIQIANSGPTLSEAEQKNLFEPFMRGENAKGISGLGLGLRIVHRILNTLDIKIIYTINAQNENVFELLFPKANSL
jgi:K+-sensing histidine kinase KdpD